MAAPGFLPEDLQRVFASPPAETKPWVFWYWMYGNVTAEGITADLEAMADSGIQTAALFSIGESNENVTVVDPPANPLSEYWWSLVRHLTAIQRHAILSLRQSGSAEHDLLISRFHTLSSGDHDVKRRCRPSAVFVSKFRPRMRSPEVAFPRSSEVAFLCIQSGSTGPAVWSLR